LRHRRSHSYGGRVTAEFGFARKRADTSSGRAKMLRR
jgi:hypothetical protein